ncbi:MAG: hypothetical protein ISS51_00680 [Dehalococcoidales bacterium]|nr:hypothetical protein [Dehalococcoidales bacterium]
MNSTRDDDTLLEVTRFFFEELMPLAKKLQDEGKAFFSVKPNPNAQTYYKKREKTIMHPESFEVVGCDSFDSFEEALIDMWTSQGYSELTKLAPTLLKLAKSLYFVEEQSEDISPFIYVMF